MAKSRSKQSVPSMPAKVCRLVKIGVMDDPLTLKILFGNHQIPVLIRNQYDETAS